MKIPIRKYWIFFPGLPTHVGLLLKVLTPCSSNPQPIGPSPLKTREPVRNKISHLQVDVLQAFSTLSAAIIYHLLLCYFYGCFISAYRLEDWSSRLTKFQSEKSHPECGRGNWREALTQFPRDGLVELLPAFAFLNWVSFRFWVGFTWWCSQTHQ